MLEDIYNSCVNGSYDAVEPAIKLGVYSTCDILHAAIRGACKGGHIGLFKKIYNYGQEWWWWSKIIINACFGENRELIRLTLDLANLGIDGDILRAHEWDYILQCICMHITDDGKTTYDEKIQIRINIIKDILGYVTRLNKTRAAQKPIHIDYTRMCVVARFYGHWHIVKFLFEHHLCSATLHKSEVAQLLNVMPNYDNSQYVAEFQQKRQVTVLRMNATLNDALMQNKMYDVKMLKMIGDYVGYE